MDSFIVKIKRLPGRSVNPLPRYMTPHSAGMDLYAELPSDLTLSPGDRSLIPTGIVLALPDGYEAQIRARSGLALYHGITLLNSPGTVDPDYRGELGVIIINHGTGPFTVKNGDRIAQIIFSKFTRVTLQEVSELEETGRNDGGFGHTGR